MYRKGISGWLKHLDFLILDLLCVNASFIVAIFLQQQGATDAFLREEVNKELYNFLITLNAIAIIVALLSHAYKNVLKRGYYRELVSVAQYVVIMFFAAAFYLFVIGSNASDSLKEILYLIAILSFFLIYVFRNIWKKIVRYRLRHSALRSMLVVTTSNIAEKVISTLKSDEIKTYKITGIVIVDKNLTGKKIKGVPVVAAKNDAADYICREWIDEVFVDIHSNMPYPSKLISEFETMGLVIHERLANISVIETKSRMVEKIGGYTVLTSTINSATTEQLFVKRLFDIIGALVGCIGTFILTLFVAPIIYIKSPGPIFFKQERVGKNGKKFKLYKFRTMYPDAEERKKELMSQNRVKDGMMFKVECDERIIGCRRLKNGKIKKGVGGWLRTLSIDECPQFFNVLKGDMSLVGTRPPTVDEWEKYELHHRARLAIKPGITGMWQVSGRSKITDFEKVVELDTQYIRDWRIVLDIKILLKTVITVFRRDGSM
ncbi:MAG: sugar transferase [Ruminococcus sp.]|nr:sugar transferase [Ruminococcus sp.]